MNATTRTMKLSELVFDETIYPREIHDPAKVQEYALHIDKIEDAENYIAIDSDNRILDGRHRHLAYLKLADGQDRDIQVRQYGQDIDSRLTAIRLNSTHGQQLTQEDKRRNCMVLYSAGYTLQTIEAELSVSHGFAQAATKHARDEKEKRENEQIFDMWLACYSQQEIGDRVGVTQPTITKKTETFITNVTNDKSYKSRAFHSEPDFKPPLYNVWTFAKKTNSVKHFGNSEQRILDNLLYLYTEPFDIVLDPFAGGGSTIDVCKERLRRYWVSDRKPIVEREHEIRLLDVVQELPPLNKRWSEVTLTFLDPPYWKQAEGEYSKDAEDLANMTLEDFTTATASVIKRISQKQSRGVIAMLMQPTQWRAPDRQYTDHIMHIMQAVGDRRLTLENRVSVPYSTEQCTPQMVDWAKENHKLLSIARELVIWRLND